MENNNSLDKDLFEKWLLKRIETVSELRDKINFHENPFELVGKGGQLKIYKEILEYIKHH